MVKNLITPRIFVAATRQDDGKTTSSIGLFAALQKRFSNIGYIKPVGQRFVEVEGAKIDEDSVLINDTYRVRSPLKAMSPIAVEPDFTRKFLSGGNGHVLHETVQAAFDEAAWEKDFIIIEGTGHAGVGSVFDLSNATVAKLLHSKVIIVSQGGIGKPIDEISINLALFEKMGVEVVGVILNKILPAKMDTIRTFAEKGLARMGLPLLGAIPYNQELRKPTLNQVCQELGGQFISGAGHKRRRVAKVVVGAMSSQNAEKYFETGALLITPGDREDLICIAAQPASTGRPGLNGIVLTGGLEPSASALEQLRTNDMPCIFAQQDSYFVAAAINQLTVKTEVGDADKIALIQGLIEKHVDIDRIVQEATPHSTQSELKLL